MVQPLILKARLQGRPGRCGQRCWRTALHSLQSSDSHLTKFSQFTQIPVLASGKSERQDKQLGQTRCQPLGWAGLGWAGLGHCCVLTRLQIPAPGLGIAIMRGMDGPYTTTDYRSNSTFTTPRPNKTPYLCLIALNKTESR